ncbi:MAG: hypothetical protein HYV08_10805 [Deltaproteobacteria bacterium]|nr:hypothetical protein [Deltaproteobacteria bacterium]MBI3078876.1 hypothetical protein [Deltaproteobacteria bacterium]
MQRTLGAVLAVVLIVGVAAGALAQARKAPPRGLDDLITYLKKQGFQVGPKGPARMQLRDVVEAASVTINGQSFGLYRFATEEQARQMVAGAPPFVKIHAKGRLLLGLSRDDGVNEKVKQAFDRFR